MNLNKPAKIILGIFTFLPLILGIGTFAFGISQFISMTFSQDPQLPLMFLSYLSYILPYLFLFFLVYLGLGIFYLVHMIQNPTLDSEKRILWIVVLITLHTFSMPAYWYAHIWKENESETSELNPDLDYPYESGTEPQKF